MHTADRHTQTPAGTAGRAHQCEGGVQGGDHHISNSQIYNEEVGGGVHPLVLDDHVAHQDVAKERDADDHRVGDDQQRLHCPALGLALVLGSAIKVPQVLQVQVTVEEGLVREAVQCREEAGGVVVLCSPEGLGHVLQGEPGVLCHGWGSRALVQPHSSATSASSDAKASGCRREHTHLPFQNLPHGCKLEKRIDKWVLLPVLGTHQLHLRGSLLAVLKSHMCPSEMLIQRLKDQRSPNTFSLHQGINLSE